MPTVASPASPSPDYLATLTRMLDLAQQTAEAASAEGNHKVVIQAIREVTRLVTLVLKITEADETPASLQPSLIKVEKSQNRGSLKPRPSAKVRKTAPASPGQTLGTRAKPTGHGSQPSPGKWLDGLASRLGLVALDATTPGCRPAGPLQF